MSVRAAGEEAAAGELAAAAGDDVWAKAGEMIPRVTRRVEAMSFMMFLCVELMARRKSAGIS